MNTTESVNIQIDQLNKLGIGFDTTPKIQLALGDDDTGLQQEGDDQLAIYTNNTERMRIDSNGNVGIGTTSPDKRLHISVDSEEDTGSLLIENKSTDSNTACAAIQYIANEGNTKHDWSTGVNRKGFYIYDDQQGSYRLVVDKDGNVGIGTSTPNWTLDVAGSFCAGHATLVVQDHGNVGIGTDSPDNQLTIKGNDDAGWDGHIKLISQNDDTIYGVISQDGNGLGFRTWGDSFYFRDKDDNTQLYIDSNGNVGIGTTSPQHALDVNGNVKIGDWVIQRSGKTLQFHYIGDSTTGRAQAWLDSDGSWHRE